MTMKTDENPKKIKIILVSSIFLGGG